MMEAYRSGDPYLAFGKQAGRIPPDGTKKTHAADRELFKACVLGVQYGMGPEALARRIGKPTAYGCELLRLHRETYPAFWRWSDGAESHAMLLNRLHTVFGWTVRVGPDANPRSLRNFPCQANGAEMMRLACCLATERGVNVVAPVHDALMIEGPADAIDEIVARTQEAWRRRRPLSWTVSGSGPTPALFGGPIGTWMVGAGSFGAECWRCSRRTPS
jgi:DNA polymerase I